MAYYIKYKEETGEFNGLLNSFFNTIIDKNIIEIDNEIHKLAMVNTFNLKDIKNIPKEIITLENIDDYFNKISNFKVDNSKSNIQILLENISQSKLKNIQNNRTINNLITQTVRNKLSNIEKDKKSQNLTNQLVQTKLNSIKKDNVLNQLANQIVSTKLEIINLKKEGNK